ncbi:hypothetical protein MmiHf6_02090 [Methanimicrococcus hongohii]|uniref:Uncharacterized protein n=1 Tax=Methanimicrococcus hongohii TaxID=3028295 RepID=A0AA96UYF2_9EURY|nr:hypothetical protein MmiHf6_02090 [Methanimicrococcus sp. Hf6]
MKKMTNRKKQDENSKLKIQNCCFSTAAAREPLHFY